MNEKPAEQVRWNQKYRDRDLASAPLTPSPFLLAQEPLLSALPKGAALDIACGDGRNSFYLASLGYTVDAVDISDVAITWVNEQAHLRGASVNPVQRDLTQSDFPQKTYQLIICFRYLQRDLFPLMINSLLPGGLLIFETMHQGYVDKLGHQMNHRFLLAHNELLRSFSSLRILFYQEDDRTGMASLVAMKMA